MGDSALNFVDGVKAVEGKASDAGFQPRARIQYLVAAWRYRQRDLVVWGHVRCHALGSFFNETRHP